MLEYEFGSRPERHPLVSLILVLLVVGLGFVVIGPIIGFLLSLPFYSGTMTELVEALQKPTENPELKIPFYIMQGSATLIGLILGPAWLLMTEGKTLKQLFANQKIEFIPVLITAFVVITFMGINSVFIDWNSSVNFPDLLKDFEKWAREKEDLAAQMTEFLTKFDSIWQLIIAMVVIAVLPAIGEEIVFRGLIQQQLVKATRNIHVAIWVAAILFSAIHFQFFGFIPRVLLGALFGYLYYWSGNLWMAIAAHFVNNGVSVLALYFYQRGTLQFNLDTPEAAPVSVVMMSVVLTGVLLYYFYHYFKQRKPEINQL
jgi:membrane protease YdiL (CAAX protease family)